MYSPPLTNSVGNTANPSSGSSVSSTSYDTTSHHHHQQHHAHHSHYVPQAAVYSQAAAYTNLNHYTGGQPSSSSSAAYHNQMPVIPQYQQPFNPYVSATSEQVTHDYWSTAAATHPTPASYYDEQVNLIFDCIFPCFSI